MGIKKEGETTLRVVWTVGDILDCLDQGGPSKGISKKEVVEFMENNRNLFHGEIISHSWEIIEELWYFHQQNKSEGEQ